jgi:hypothetical protein
MNKICCFIDCNMEVGKYGNNPSPYFKGQDKRCCDICNKSRVIPTRLYLMMKKRDNKNENSDNSVINNKLDQN